MFKNGSVVFLDTLPLFLSPKPRQNPSSSSTPAGFCRMGRRKSENKGSAAISSDKAPEVLEKMSLADQDGVDEVLEDSVETVIGSDKTSADYYFDSYSHFGLILSCLLFLFGVF